VIVCERLKPINVGDDGESLDLNETSNTLVYDVRKYSLVSVQADKQSTWATAVLTMYHSATGKAAIAAAAVTGTLGPGSDYEKDIDVNTTAFLIVKVTTVEGSRFFADIAVYGAYSQ
jgi:hypothetical protein